MLGSMKVLKLKRREQTKPVSDFTGTGLGLNPLLTRSIKDRVQSGRYYKIIICILVYIKTISNI